MGSGPKKPGKKQRTAEETEAQSAHPAREPGMVEPKMVPGRGLPRTWRRALFGLAVTFSLLWVAGHAYWADRVTVRLCEKADQGIAPEERIPVFLHTIAFDGYIWNRHAEHLGRDGAWRLRYTDLDNAPEGREVHWNSAFAWYLRGLGELRRAGSGETLRQSIFRMSIWANPILLALVLCLFPAYAARRFGFFCGAIIALGMVSVPSYYEGFFPAYPDHHGLIALTIFGLAFGIAWAGAGWVQPRDGTDRVLPRSLRQARAGMILSALSGAAGLWISAISAALVLGMIGVAILFYAFFFARFPEKKPAAEFYPGLWKTWTAWGAMGSLGFYLLEYFPGHMGMRLEVNHPFYALTWLGGGWAIVIATRWMRDSARERRPFPWQAMIPPGVCCAILPLAVLIGRASVHSIADPFMIRLHTHISEFMPLLPSLVHGRLTYMSSLGLFPLLLVAALLLQAAKGIGRGAKIVLIVLSIPMALMTLMQFYQIRWGLLAAPLHIALAAFVIPLVWECAARRRVWVRIVVAGLLLTFFYSTVSLSSKEVVRSWRQYRSGPDVAATHGQALALLHRRMARAIQLSAGDTPVVLLSSPNSSCLLAAMGGFRTLGTLYWENTRGLTAAARGYHAQSDEEALAFIRKHGVTHLSFMTWEHFIVPYFQLLHPDPAPGISLDNAFAKRIFFDRVVPPWTRPLLFAPDELSRALDQRILMLQFVPDQSMAEAWLYAARFVRHVEEKPEAAEPLYLAVINDDPRDGHRRVELANLYLSINRNRDAADQLIAALEWIPPGPRRELAEQASEWMAGRGEEGLAAEIRAALNRHDEPASP